MASDRNIDIKGDASGNVLVTGDHNVVRVVIVQSTTYVEPVAGENPYRGLQAFEERHALLFFGREETTSRLWEMGAELLNTRRPRLLAVLGRSGSGKSSVVRAGLLPTLARRAWPDTELVGAAVFAPGADPLQAFERAVAKARVAIQTHAAARRRLVIVADQFEALLANRIPADMRRAFVDQLLAAARVPDGEIFIIVTLRSDFLGALQDHPDLESLIADREHHRIVAGMSRKELEAAIASPMPAECPLPPALVGRLVDQAHGREGSLPLLQYTLTQLWEGMAKGIAPERYFEDRLDGSIAKAIATEADLLLEELMDDRRKAIARRAFAHMVELHDQTLVRRPASLRSIVGPGESADEVLEVLRHFAERRARLLTLSSSLGERSGAAEVVATIAHEALITSWPMLRMLVTMNPEDHRFHGSLAEDAEKWDRDGRPAGSLWRPPNLELLRAFVDRRRGEMTAVELAFHAASERAWKARGRWRAVAIAGVVVLALILTGGAFWVAERQEQLTKDAVDAKEEAERQTVTAKENLQQAYRALALAIWNDIAANNNDTPTIQHELIGSDDPWTILLGVGILMASDLSAAPFVTEDPLTVRERNALWALATQRDALIQYFVDELRHKDRQIRFGKRVNQINRALGPAWASVEETAFVINGAVSSIDSTSDDTELRALARVVQGIGPNITQRDAAHSTEVLLRAIPKTKDIATVLVLLDAIRTIAKNLRQEDAHAQVSGIIDAIQGNYVWFVLDALAQSAAVLANAISPADAGALATLALEHRRSELTYENRMALLRVAAALAITIEQRSELLVAAVGDIEPSVPSFVQGIAETVGRLAPGADPLALEAALQGFVDKASQFEDTSVGDALPAMVQTAKALSAGLPVTQVESVATKVIQLMADGRSSVAVATLAYLLPGLSITVDQAARAFGTVRSAIVASDNSSKIALLTSAAKTLAPMLAPGVGQSELIVLVNSILATDDADKQKALGAVAQSVGPQVPIADSQVVVTSILSKIEDSYDSTRVIALGRTAAGLQLTSKQSSLALTPVMRVTTRTTNPFLLEAFEPVRKPVSAEEFDELFKIIEIIGPNLSQDNTLDVISGGVEKIQPDYIDDSQRIAYARILAILGKKLPSERLRDSVIIAMNNINDDAERSPAEVGALATVVRNLGQEVSSEDARNLVRQLVESIQRSDNADAQSVLADAIVAISSHAFPDGSTDLSEAMGQSLGWASTAASAERLARAYVSLLPRTPTAAFGSAIAGALAFPTTPGLATEILLEALGEIGGPGKAGGLSATMKWLRAEPLLVDLNSLPICPEPDFLWPEATCPIKFGAISLR